MRLTSEQRAALLERLAAVLEEETTTDGHHELVYGENMNGKAAAGFVRLEAARLRRRAWVLRNT